MSVSRFKIIFLGIIYFHECYLLIPRPIYFCMDILGIIDKFIRKK